MERKQWDGIRSIEVKDWLDLSVLEIRTQRAVWPDGGGSLAPCPFCGSTRQFLHRDLRDGYQDCQDDPDAYAYYVFCTGCAAEGPWRKTASGALVEWCNREGRGAE